MSTTNYSASDLPPPSLGSILKFTWPILLTQSAQAGFGLLDTIMGGRVSAADLAAVSIGAGLWLPLFLLIVGVLSAVTPLVAEAKGANQPKAIRPLVQQGIWLALGLGVAGGLLLQLIPLAFDWLKTPLELRAKTALYLHGIALGLPAIGIYAVLRCYIEALGFPRPVTVISFLALAVNIPVNWWFIYGGLGVPALGGAGCGFATALVQWGMLAVLIGYIQFAAPFQQTKPFLNWSRPQWLIKRKILHVGLPIGAAVFFETSLFGLAAIVLAPLGAVAVAAHQVTLSVTSQLFMIPLSLGIALTILTGQRYGAQDSVGIKQLWRYGFGLAITSALAMMILLALTRHQLVTVYTDDLGTQELAAQLLLFAVAYQLVDACQVVAAGCLRGIQDTRRPMWLTLFSYWLVAFPVGFYLARYTAMGAKGFWLGLAVGLTVAAILLGWRIRGQARRLPLQTLRLS